MSGEEDDIILSELADDELVEQMHQDLYDGLKEEIEEGVQILLERGWPPYRVLTEALVEGMRIVGIDFRDGILFVPEVLMAAKAMKAGMAILRPLLAETGAEKAGTVVIGTVMPILGTIEAPGTIVHGPKYPEHVARTLEVEAERERLASAIAPHVKDVHYVGLPAVLGIYKTTDILADLEARLGVRVFEIPTMPPAITGLPLMPRDVGGFQVYDVQPMFPIPAGLAVAAMAAASISPGG